MLSRGITLRAFCGCTLLFILAAYPIFKFETVVPRIDSMTKMSAIAFSWMFLLIGRLFACDPQSDFVLSPRFSIISYDLVDWITPHDFDFSTYKI